MRFYSLAMTDGTTGQPVLPSSLGGNAITSLLPNGQFNQAALNIEFDIPFAPAAAPVSGAFLRIWGLGLKDISSALDLTPPNKPAVNIMFKAGMSAGLPLAKPQQQGLLLQGSILQAWGNWVGVNQTLDMTFTPTIGSPAEPVNFSFSWLKGTPLKDAIATTLTAAYPNQKQMINISPALVINYDEHGVYQTLGQLADFINGISKFIIGGTYEGVNIASDGQTIRVWDGVTVVPNSTVKSIAFEDMIGQPTWIDTNTITVPLVLRGDLSLQDVIKMPQSLATSTQQSYLRFQDKSAFTGNYAIQQIHHYGNFRQPDASSWNTTIQATLEPNQAVTPTPTPTTGLST